jgi:hypothetical protein
VGSGAGPAFIVARLSAGALGRNCRGRLLHDGSVDFPLAGDLLHAVRAGSQEPAGASEQLFGYVGAGKTKIVAKDGDANTAVASIRIHLENNGHVAADAPQRSARPPRLPAHPPPRPQKSTMTWREECAFLAPLKTQQGEPIGKGIRIEPPRLPGGSRSAVTPVLAAAAVSAEYAGGS